MNGNFCSFIKRSSNTLFKFTFSDKPLMLFDVSLFGSHWTLNVLTFSPYENVIYFI